MAPNLTDSPNKKRDPEAIRSRKKRVLSVATAEFASKGFSSADMDHIAELARVGKGTIYRYYGSKEQLFLTAAEEAINSFRDFIFSAIRMDHIKNPLQQLRAAARAFLSFFDENRSLLEIFLHERSHFRGIMQTKYLQMYSENIEILQNLVDDCIHQGLIKRLDSRKLVDSVGDMLTGLVYMWGIREKEGSLSSKWPLVEEIIFKGLLTT